MPVGLDIATAAGIGGANNVMDIAFGGIRQKQQLRGQQKSLEQSNAAQYDLWKKTGAVGQMEQLGKAGLNPGLIYGMGGAGGATTGTPGQAPTAGAQGGGGMDIAGAAQIRLLNAQAKKLEAETAELGTRGKLQEGQTARIAPETAKLTAETKKINLDSEMQRILNDIKEDTQWYERGEAAQKWMKLTQETRSAAAKADVDQSTIENDIAMKGAELVTEGIKQEAMKSGIKLNDQQIKESQAAIVAMMKNAETNRWNAETGARGAGGKEAETQLKKDIEITANTLGVSRDIVEKVMLAFGLGGALKQMTAPKHVPVEGFKQKY